MNDAVSQYKENLLDIMRTLEGAFSKGNTVEDVLEYHTDAVDSLLIRLWGENGSAQKYCLVAIGGYGRRELYPYSDIDILILTEKSIVEDPFLEYFLQTVWDLKLKASPITATQEELAVLCQENLATLTSILDQRYLSGSKELYDNFCRHSLYFLPLSPQEFYFQKKQEQQSRHHRIGQYAFSLEPNVKESPGGLRDMQTLLWCSQYARLKQAGCFKPHLNRGFLSEFSALKTENILSADESEKLVQAYLFLARIRFALHFQARKKEDRLPFEMQSALAASNNESQREFMKNYYDAVLILMRYQNILEKSFLWWLSNKGISNSPLIKIHPKENEILDALLHCEDSQAVQNIALPFVRAVEPSQISPQKALSLESQRLFLKLFNTAPHVYSRLKMLRLWGVLPCYLPELQSALGLMQQSLFHRYSVDEHTLLLTEMIDKFHEKAHQEKHPLCHELVFSIHSPQVLYLAALLHDSGKGHLEDHSLVGEKLATAVSKRLKDLLSEEEQDNLIWLVKNHLLMSTVAQKQDIHDPEVIIAFSKKVDNLNRLKLLYLLTVADISATNPTLWNAWKDSLLRKLYLSTEKSLQCDHVMSSSNKMAAHRKRKGILLLSKHSVEARFALALWDNWPNVYFLHHSVPSIAKHTKLVLKRQEGQDVFYFSDHPKQGCYELFIYCKDRPFLFSLFTNILEKENLNIVSADILTTQKGYALDSFYLLREEAYSKKRIHLLQRLETALRELKERQSPPFFNRRFHKQRLLPNMTTEIRCHVRKEQNVTEVEIVSYDRPGLLAKIGLVFSEHKLNLQQAKIATLGQRIEDIFVVTNCAGQILSDHEAAQLTQALKQVLNEI